MEFDTLVIFICYIHLSAMQLSAYVSLAFNSNIGQHLDIVK